MRAEDWEVVRKLRRQEKNHTAVKNAAPPSREVLSSRARRHRLILRELEMMGLAILIAVAGACSGGPINPKTGPGTDYPCGTQGRSCGYGMCCGLSEECGYGLGCPAGYCCPLEDDFYGASAGASSNPRMYRQWPAGSPSAK